MGEINFGETVTYTCIAGHENQGGPLDRTCDANGALSGVDPFCQRMYSSRIITNIYLILLRLI